MRIDQICLQNKENAHIQIDGGRTVSIVGELGQRGFLSTVKGAKWIDKNSCNDVLLSIDEIHSLAMAIETNNQTEKNREHIIMFEDYDVNPSWGFSASNTKICVRGVLNYLDITYSGKTMRISGFRDFEGFVAKLDTARWLPPHEGEAINERELADLASKTIKLYKGSKGFRICFMDAWGKSCFS